MAVKVSFGGQDLMNDGEGNFGFMPGVFPERGRDFVSLGRSETMLMRELSTPGCVHVVELRFYGMDADTVRDRLQDAYGRGVATLSVRGYDNINNCAMVSPPSLSAGSYSRPVGGGAAGTAFVVSVTFQQVS